MDQVQKALKILKEHYFWFLCGFVVLASGVSWFMTTSWLQTETDSRISALDQQFSAVQSIRSTPLHPNDKTNAGMEALNEDYKGRVAKAWEFQFEQQKEILVWPNILSRKGMQTVRSLKPIETTVPFITPHDESQEKLNANDRDQYRNFINRELPKLAEIIDAQWAATARRDSVVGKEYLVDWNASNQEQLVSSRFEWPTVPITLQVLYAQEDLWVMTALMEIIRNTNAGATARYQAPIKEIDFIDIGPDAIGLAGKVDGASSSSSMGMGGLRSGMGGMGMGGMGMGEGPGAAGLEDDGGTPGGGQQAVTIDPAENRYVDKDFKPISAERLRAAYESKSPEDAPLAVAKRMPVRMRLKVDFREINNLLATCGNNRLPVEVRQVRVNRPGGSTFGGGGRSMGSMGGMGGGGGGSMTLGSPPGGFGGENEDEGMGSGMGGGRPGMMGSGRGGMMGGMMGGMLGGGATAAPAASVWDVDVEIYGMVYIYNPVDFEKIGKKLEAAVDSATPTDSAAAPTNPVPAG